MWRSHVAMLTVLLLLAICVASIAATAQSPCKALETDDDAAKDTVILLQHAPEAAFKVHDRLVGMAGNSETALPGVGQKEAPQKLGPTLVAAKNLGLAMLGVAGHRIRPPNLQWGIVCGVGVGCLALLFACSFKVHQRHNDWHKHPEQVDDEKDPLVRDTMTYHVGWLRGWKTFIFLKNTIWYNMHLWMMLGLLLVVSILIALLTWMLAPGFDAAQKFDRIATMLNIFVAMILGFFLSSAVNRWLHCVDGYFNLFNAIRNLAMQLHTLGVPQERRCLAQRYCLLSVRFLMVEISSHTMPSTSSATVFQTTFDDLVSSQRTLYYMTAKERDVLVQVRDTAGQLWLWISSIVGRMAQDGDIPPMASPTYGRIMNLCQDAQSSIRDIRQSMKIQMPFAYTHTLATLIHVTNFAFAISLGLSLGCFLNTMTDRPHVENGVPDLLVTVMRCTLSPMLYQTFFELGLHLSTSSFRISGDASSTDSHIPVTKMLDDLERDLHDSEILAEQPPCWDKPCFKAK